MVRETRHLWVGNLPDNIREDRIREHFKRYGRVQNVKLLGRTESGSTVANANGATNSGVCATVAFMDIKSASKAHNAEHVLDERTLTTEYYEPAAIPSAAGAPSAGSSPAGSGYSGSSSSVNSTPAPSSVSRYHLSGGEESTGSACPIAATAAAPANWRGTNDSASEYCRRGNTPAAYSRYRNNANAPYSTPPSNVERTTPHHRWYAGGDRGSGGGSGGGTGGGGAGGGATGGESTPSTPGGGTESGRRRRPSGSGSSRSESSSPEPSDTSRASTPQAPPPPLAHHANHRAPSTPSHHHQWSSTASGRPLAICVRNLPTRSTDSSLKDGLYHEYKKHGKVVWVKVVGQNADRYAVVRFKKPSDVEKALEVSQDKLFFGCKISVAPHQSCDEDADSAKPYETDIDEYHPKATRTLFIGNLEKDVTQQQLRDKFKHFGRIIEIDIKKGSGGGAGYAFCQYASISSVVEAIRAMDGEYVGGSRVKLGFGKPVATTCVWVDGLTEHTEKQEAFYEQLEKHGGAAALSGLDRITGEISSSRYLSTARHDALRYDGCGSRARASSYGRGSSRTPRYPTLDHYDSTEYTAERRYRVYDELGSSPQTEDTPFEDRLQSVVVSPHRARRHRRDSSPEDRKHSKERHRSVGGSTVVSCVGTARRSRSGSRGGERHGGRRRHRRRRDGSGSRGSRAGTPLRDEPDAPPAEPRRPPRERPPLPMSLPLPKFAVQLLRQVPPTPRPTPAPAPAPDSPPRPPSVSSSSGGSAPHSPSLEERIRSLDEKYEKWSGSRALADAPDRTRLRHRLLEVDINEVKPSEVVRSLLAKRSVFDEDSERLEGAVRAPSPASSPRARPAPPTPRVLRCYPFPTHNAHQPLTPTTPSHVLQMDADIDLSDRPADPRLNRSDRSMLTSMERVKFGDNDPRFESRVRPRTPSTDRSQLDSNDRRSPRPDVDSEVDPRGIVERRRRNSSYGANRSCADAGIDTELSSVSDTTDLEHRSREKRNSLSSERRQSVGKIQDSAEKKLSEPIDKKDIVKLNDDNNSSVATNVCLNEDNKPRESGEMLLKRIGSFQDIKPESFVERRSKSIDEYNIKSELPAHIHEEIKSTLENETKFEDFNCQIKSESERPRDIFTQNHVKKEFLEIETQHNHLNSHNLVKKDIPELSQDFIKNCEKNGKERYNQNIMLEALHITKLEKENIEFEKCFEKDKFSNAIFFGEKKMLESEKISEDRVKNDKSRHGKDRHDKEKQEKHETEKERAKSTRHEKMQDKIEKEKRPKDDNNGEKVHLEKSEKHKDSEKSHKDKSDRDTEKTKHSEEKSSRHDHHRKEKSDKEKRKDSADSDIKVKKDDKSKHEKSRKDSSDSKREHKKDSDSSKVRKSSRDESSRDIYRKDSTDSSTSRASHDSSKLKELDVNDIKEEPKSKKNYNDIICKSEIDKEVTSKCMDIIKFEPIVKVKTEPKEGKDQVEHYVRTKNENAIDHTVRSKSDITEKQRHYSLDSPNVDSKRKERLNSCSSLPSNIGHKRRMSSQDSLDCLNEDLKKSKNEGKYPDRRDSKDSRNVERHKTTKFNKCHFAKIIESKTKDDKKNQVKPPDDSFEFKESEHKEEMVCPERLKTLKKSPAVDVDEKICPDVQSEGLQNDIDFLATLELRSSEEDEKQKALRKEMKEKKRIQQLQQIQELQMQQDAMQQAELMNKLKDDKKKTDEKKKEAARDKRMSTDRKSRDDKNDSSKPRKNRKAGPSTTDTSDSDEPKKHSIFDIIDDGPTYISMYDKVKARSCKNMQKQEEEKRQEKIKAKFSQLKQSRAKREEKKRSSWDEDSDSDHERKRANKSSMDSSTDDENMVIHNKKREKIHASSSLDYEHNKTNDYFSAPSNEEDSRNKLSRKNSRTRIMSDTSDDEASKRSISKSPNFTSEVKKDVTSDSEPLHRSKDDSVHSKDTSEDKIKKNSLLNLFGKSDSDDSKIKSGLETDIEYKPNFTKSIPNDFSSESESALSNRNMGEMRKKHKKKQKKHKSSSVSDSENKFDNEGIGQEGETKHKISEKVRRHSTKKEKRKDKIRESIDTDEPREEKNKIKRDKKLTNTNFDTLSENLSKKDGKMEDIFGPLSDESDRETRNKVNNTSHSYITSFGPSNEQSGVMVNCEDGKFKDKDDNKRKRDKKRKDKRFLFKEDDNSLDVDAVSKAIEARLFAESITDDDNRAGLDELPEYIKKIEQSELKHISESLIVENKVNERHIDKMKKDCREKKKKKKRNREDRQSRKDHHHLYHHDKIDKSDVLTESVIDISSKDMLLDIPLPSGTPTPTITDKSDDNKSLCESPSLPRLIDSPPIIIQANSESEQKQSELECTTPPSKDTSMEIDYPETNQVEVDDIPMPPPIENIDISEVPLPEDPPIEPPIKRDNSFVPNFNDDIDKSESAVRSISNLNENDKQVEKADVVSCKVEKKAEEKPRAIISQEETEDAVAALLGESFGGKVNSFADCYEPVENNPIIQTEIETTSIETENIPEEDAEEMRQAVQNLNASEMEIKPDTPVSDNDLLLIDTDTEEADETPQDAIERLPVNIIATNQSLANVTVEQPKSTEVPSIVIAKPKTTIVQVVTSNATGTSAASAKVSEPDVKIQLAKRETGQQITSTATPVITSWISSLSSNKIVEPHVLNIQPNALPNRDKSESKPTHITANIVQIKAAQGQNVHLNNTLRPIITPNRVGAPYQVINQMIRPQTPNMQPPTIKIPEPHIIYQKPSGIVISPRMTNDPRMQSPKTPSQGEGMTSPRLSNMTILSTSPQNINSVGIASPNTLQQRSPGQVTVVRMQQPPLSPIQAMHIPHGARTMVSPNRPNSVLVQTQGTPIHFNRLPVTPVLAPISKQISINNVVQQNKGINVSTSTLIHQQKIINEEKRKADQRAGTENVNDNAKILLSPTSLPQSTNPTVMAQNRLITMQHAVHVGNMNSALHLGNKVLLNNLNQLNDKRDNQIQKSEQLNHLPFGTTPIIHVTGVNPSTASIIQSVSKPVMCTLQEANTISRSHGSNVIHTMNSQRLLTTAPMSNVIQIDANKGSPSVLSMATIRPPTVLTKLESTKSIAATTTCLANVVMTPLLLKTTNASGAIILNPKADQGDNHGSTNIPLANHISRENEIKLEVKEEATKIPPFVYDSVDKSKESYKPNMSNSVETIAKCETDFEELLKDNTNEIKVTNDPEKKLEVNVGKTVTLITPQNRERKQSIDGGRKDEAEKNKPIPVSEQSSIEGILPSKSEENVPNTQVDKENKESSVIENSMVINSANKENKLNPEIPIKEVPIKDIPVITPTVITNNTKSEPEKSPEFGETSKPTEDKFFSLISKNIENSDNHIKNLDENDSWSDVNIESVIKKVDSLCNENMDVPDKEEKIPPEITEKTTNSLDTITNNTIETLPNDDDNKPMDVQIETTVETTVSDNTSSPGKPSLPGKRGGRSVRGKKSDKNSDRVQTRQISKPARGGTSARRGRGGRAKVDKKIKNMVNSNTNNIPGDVYDFHEDSGDEDTSPNRTETRPRLILTIKSPLSGHCATPTSTLSITPKDQPKVGEKITKDEKPEDFLSPSLNTRKSRRLQEKDVQKSNTDEALDDFVRSPATPAKTGKRKPGRQTGVKAGQADTRKSPRGVKRTRDRSLSDTSIDSGDEKVLRTPTEPTREAKTPRLAEPTVPAKPEPETPPPAPKPAPPPTVVQQPTPAPMPTPIMKPPKKMISEISAKLAGAFETATVRGPITVQQTPPTQFLHQQPERPQESPAEKSVMIREPAQAAPAVADAEFRAEPLGEAYARRLVDNVPGNMVPVGATEATDARVQSPALPHRPPSTHRPADRATPVLIRGGESEGAMGPGGGVGVGGAAGPGLGHVNIGLGSGVGVGVGAGVGVGVGAGAGVGVGAGGSRFRGAYAGPASLPRGAHHPPHPQHAPHPQLPHLPPHSPHPPHTQHPQHPHVPVGHAAHIKQVAVVGPHHHTHPAAASRVTLTSVPSISPQGQIGMGDNMYPHFSHQHYQVYQQHFRATQHESRATPSPYTRSLEAEGCEAPTPPLELRRPPSARVPRPAHSPAPADRLIMYAVGCGRSPPPAHGTSRLPGALPPSTAPGPPHASQVPREADSLQMLLRRYPVMWQGLLALKNDSAAVQMHFVGGNPGVAGDTLPRHADGSTPLLRIAQRMRLEPAQLDQVHRKMKLESEHCMLLALPCGRDHMDVLQQSTNLTAGFITYLQRKQAAGIVNVAPPGHQQALFTVHIFPSCDFANENLNRIAPDLMHRVADIAHLLIVIATV